MAYEDHIFEEEQQIADERATNLGTAILTNPIRALKLHPPVTVNKDCSIHDATLRMTKNKVGCVIVEEGQKLAGIFTERDVLTKVVPFEIDVEHTSVESVMTRDPETLSPDLSIAHALNKMTVGGFRHIPLVDGGGCTVGVVGMRDIVNYIVDLFPQEVLNLPPEPDLSIARTREGA